MPFTFLMEYSFHFKRTESSRNFIPFSAFRATLTRSSNRLSCIAAAEVALSVSMRNFRGTGGNQRGDNPAKVTDVAAPRGRAVRRHSIRLLLEVRLAARSRNQLSTTPLETRPILATQFQLIYDRMRSEARVGAMLERVFAFFLLPAILKVRATASRPAAKPSPTAILPTCPSLCLAVACLAVGAAPLRAEPKWTLDPASSSLTYQSIKKNTIVETNSIRNITGEISPEGAARSVRPQLGRYRRRPPECTDALPVLRDVQVPRRRREREA